jgi:hypothetical protein
MTHVDPKKRASDLLQWLEEDEDRPVYVHSPPSAGAPSAKAAAGAASSSGAATGWAAAAPTVSHQAKPSPRDGGILHVGENRDTAAAKHEAVSGASSNAAAALAAAGISGTGFDVIRFQSALQLEESSGRVALLSEALSAAGDLWLAALADRQKHYAKLKTVLNNRSLIAADLIKEMHEAQQLQRGELAQAMKMFQMLGQQRQQQAGGKKR